MFLRDVCGFLKRRTSFVTSEGADKKLLKIFREHQPSAKVRPEHTSPQRCYTWELIATKIHLQSLKHAIFAGIQRRVPWAFP